jgi:ankyrin repeat protein
MSDDGFINLMSSQPRPRRQFLRRSSHRLTAEDVASIRRSSARANMMRHSAESTSRSSRSRSIRDTEAERGNRSPAPAAAAPAPQDVVAADPPPSCGQKRRRSGIMTREQRKAEEEAKGASSRKRKTPSSAPVAETARNSSQIKASLWEALRMNDKGLRLEEILIKSTGHSILDIINEPQGPSRRTLLMAATALGNEAMVGILLMYGAEPRAESTGAAPHTALARAAQNGHLAIITLLLHSGCISRDFSFGKKHLEEACMISKQMGHMACLKQLLEFCWDDHPVDGGIKMAAAEGHPLSIRVCCGTEELNWYCWRRQALAWASSKGLMELVRFLVALDPSENDDSWDLEDACYWAICGGQLDVLRFLLTRRLSTMQGGSSMLMMAALQGHMESVTALYAGTGIDEEWESSSLRWASSAGHLHIVRLLLGSGVDANARCRDGWPPLMHACAGGHLAVAQLLINNGADVNASVAGLPKMNALVRAASLGRTDAVLLLMQWGAVPSPEAVAAAVASGHHHIVPLLMDSKAMKLTLARSSAVSSSIMTASSSRTCIGSHPPRS